MPLLGSRGGGSNGGKANWPRMALGAWAVMNKFGEVPMDEPRTLETWRLMVLPALGNEMEALSKATHLPSKWYGNDRYRIESRVYNSRCAGLFVEFCRVNQQKAESFIARLMAQDAANDYPNCTVRAISEWVLSESIKPRQLQQKSAFDYFLPRRLINAWEAHCNGRSASKRVVRIGKCKIHGSRLIWWPGSDDKPERTPLAQ